ncbi:MAG: uridine kinase [Filifactoraceae bacterium]
MEKALIIGIAGGSGSGKTTLAKKIKETFQEETLLLSHDYYYKAHDDISFEERCKLNYDHPNAFETDLLVRHLGDLKNLKEIERPVYDFADHNRAKETVIEIPKKVVILEGILIFEDKRLVDSMDIRIFVDTDGDVRFARRLLRDTVERGRSIESVVGQYFDTVKPMHEAFVEPSKKNADIIVPEGGMNHVAISMINDKISYFLYHKDKEK